MAEGEVNVGGVSFSIGISLAEYQKALERAEKLAREHAQRIQQTLSNINPPNTGGGGNYTGGVSGTGGSSYSPPSYATGGASGGGGRTASRSSGLAALDKAERDQISHYVRQGFDREVATAYVRKAITGAEFWSTHPGSRGQNAAEAAQRARALLDRVGPQAPLSGGTSASGAATGTGRNLSQREAERIANITGAPFTRLTAAARARATMGPQQLSASQLTRAEQQRQAADDREARRTAAAQARMGPFEVPMVQQQRAAAIQARELARAQAAMGPHEVPMAQQQRQAVREAADLARERAKWGPFELSQGQQETNRRRYAIYRGNGGDDGDGNGGGGGGRFLGLSNTNLARVGAGLIGLNLGINIAAGAARALHDAIVATVESVIQLEQSGRRVSVAFGASGQSFLGSGATSFARNPLTSGTQTDYQQVVSSLAPLAAQYNLTTSQVQQLAVASGELARIQGVDVKSAGDVLQQVMHGNLEAGQALDLQLTDQYGVIKGVGLTWEQLVISQGEAGARATVLAQVQNEVTRQLRNNAENADAATRAFDSLGKSWDNFRNSVASGARGPISQLAQDATSLLNKPPSALQIAGTLANPVGIASAVNQEFFKVFGDQLKSVVTQSIEEGLNDAKDLFAKFLAGLKGTPSPSNEPQPNSPPAAVSPQQAAVDAAQARVDAARNAIGQPTAVPFPTNNPDYVPPVPANPAPDIAQANEELATAKAEAERKNAEREIAFRRNQARLPGLNNPQSLQTITPADTLQWRNDDIIRQMRVSGVQVQSAQGTIAALDIAAKERQIAKQQELNEYSKARLYYEGQLAPVLLQQQAVQDAITIGTMENLTLTKAVLEAKRTEVPAGQALEAVDFKSRQAVLRAQVSMVDAVSGKPQQFDIGAQLGQVYGAALDRPQAALNELEAQHGINVASFAQAVDQLTKAINVIPLQEEKQLIDQQVMLLNEQLAAAQAGADTITRALEFATLLAGPARIEAERALTEAMKNYASAQKAQADATLANLGPGAIGDIITTIVVGGNPGTPVPQDINNAAESATRVIIDAINRRGQVTLPRLVPSDAGAR